MISIYSSVAFVALDDEQNRFSDKSMIAGDFLCAQQLPAAVQSECGNWTLVDEESGHFGSFYKKSKT